MPRLTLEAFLTDEELAALLRAARERVHRNALRDHTLLALLANCGLRPGEALRLCRKHVHAASAKPWIRVLRMRQGDPAGKFAGARGKRKLRPTDDLPISKPLARVLSAYVRRLAADSETPLFPLTVRQIERLFHVYAARAGLPRSRRVYCLRHTTALRLMRATGNNMQIVQRMLGHVDPQTTMRYLHTDPALMRQTVERLGAVV